MNPDDQLTIYRLVFLFGFIFILFIFPKIVKWDYERTMRKKYGEDWKLLEDTEREFKKRIEKEDYKGKFPFLARLNKFFKGDD